MTMFTEENKRVFRRVIEEIINTGNLDLADELIAEDFVLHRTGLYTSTRVFKPS
jgi:hypothetical protein